MCGVLSSLASVSNWATRRSIRRRSSKTSSMACSYSAASRGRLRTACSVLLATASGVRNSCDASAVNRRWACMERCSRSSMSDSDCTNSFNSPGTGRLSRWERSMFRAEMFATIRAVLPMGLNPARITRDVAMPVASATAPPRIRMMLRNSLISL
ncbi:MAG: hypothetical protein BWX88_00237 [Planctomycetes bacterium ADurb.Bin126]|nr:MAG: hypothetical protein BWX88_00237 [Planctomycetes bacterium ADurb.Bin126]